MKKIDLGQTISIFANLGVIAGIAFLAIELNQNTAQLALELEWQINQRMVDNNRDLMSDDRLAVFVKSVEDPESLTYEEFQTATALTFNFLNVWEDRYFLHEAGLISDADWKEFIDKDIHFTLGYKFARAFWETGKVNYEPELVAYVDAILPNISDTANYQFYVTTMQRLRDME